MSLEDDELLLVLVLELLDLIALLGGALAWLPLPEELLLASSLAFSMSLLVFVIDLRRRCLGRTGRRLVVKGGTACRPENWKSYFFLLRCHSSPFNNNW